MQLTIDELRAFAHRMEAEASDAAHRFLDFVERELHLKDTVVAEGSDAGAAGLSSGDDVNTATEGATVASTDAATVTAETPQPQVAEQGASDTAASSSANVAEQGAAS